MSYPVREEVPLVTPSLIGRGLAQSKIENGFWLIFISIHNLGNINLYDNMEV